VEMQEMLDQRKRWKVQGIICVTVGPFFLAHANTTHQLTDPTQPTTPTQ